MLNKRSFIFGLFIIVWLISTKVLAGLDTLTCMDCDSLEMEMMAKSQGQPNDSVTVVVMDYINDVARKYTVYQTKGNYGELQNKADSAPLTNEELEDAEAIFQLRKDLILLLREAEKLPVFDLESGQPIEVYNTSNTTASVSLSSDAQHWEVAAVVVRGNPYNYSSASSLRNDVYDYYASEWRAAFSELVVNTNNKINLPLAKEMKIQIEITFVKQNVDGTTEYNGVVVASVKHIPRLLETLSIRDKYNNNVPQTESDVIGNIFTLPNPEAIQEFEAYINAKFFSGSQGTGICSVVRRKVSGQIGDEKFEYVYQCS